PSASVPGNAFFLRSRRPQLFGLSRPAGPPLHGPVCQRSVGNPRVRPGRAWTLQTLEPVAGSPAAAGRWRGCAERREWLPSPAGRHGGPVSQLRVGSVADPVADRAHADGVLRLAGPVAGAGGRAGAQQPFAGPDVRCGDPGLFHPSRPALNDVLRPQRPHLGLTWTQIHEQPWNASNYVSGSGRNSSRTFCSQRQSLFSPCPICISSPKDPP
ncbi:hypothetical protein LEMLEM_LOCUS250, partial [Lemmus lemmus]